MNELNLKEKLCIVTGASSGIGKGTALLLAKAGADVVMLSRDNKRGRRAFRQVKQAARGGRVEWIPADLSSQDSVRNFVGIFQERHQKLHILFNCAGVQYLNRVITVDGLEAMFATNYLGHFLLTTLLMESLKAGAPSLVINISGRRHKSPPGEGVNEGSIRFNDLQGEHNYSFAQATRQATLARILFTYETARRWEKHGIYACTLCPGTTRTGLFNNFPWRARLHFYFRSLRKKAQTPEEAARHLISLASKTSYKNINGKYFEGSRGLLQEARSSPESYNAETAARLWEISEELVRYSTEKRFS